MRREQAAYENCKTEREMMMFTAFFTMALVQDHLPLTTYTKNDATTVETTLNGARAPDLAFPIWVLQKAFHGHIGSLLLVSISHFVSSWIVLVAMA